MVANITTGKDVYGALAYNQEKVDRGDGKVLLTHIVREPADGRFNVAATAEDLLRWMPSHYRTEKPVVHVSLNPAPEDRLDDGQLAEIAGAYMERMGWGGQPYIVFKHTDIGREHIHIVSVQVAQDGRKINDSRRNERSVAVTEELEREYGLHPAKGRRREKGQGIVPADYTRGDLKRQVAAVIKPAVATYRFQTLGEFRALLSLYNIGIEEVRGERNGTPYRGLLYTLLDENGEPCVGAVIMIPGTKIGTNADVDGYFKLSVPDKTKELQITYVGCKPLNVEARKDVGEVILQSDSKTLQDVVITQSVARTRKTPVALSQVDALTIEAKLGNQEFPEVLKTTPGVWATPDGGGFGDAKNQYARLQVRERGGTDQRCTHQRHGMGRCILEQLGRTFRRDQQHADPAAASEPPSSPLHPWAVPSTSPPRASTPSVAAALGTESETT